MALLTEPLRAADAERFGLVTRVVPVGDIVFEARAVAVRLAGLAPRVVQRPLRERDGPRGEPGQPSRHRPGLVHRLVAGHDPHDEPEPFGVGRRQRFAEQRQLGRLGRADQPGQQPRAPLSGMSPTRPNASRKLALSAAIRRSQANASDAPAPAAIPLIAPTIGWSSARIARMIGL